LPKWRKNRHTNAHVDTLPRINIIDENCTGCTLCVQDCPYNALEMVQRKDKSPHQLIAIADQSMCTSCGICIGSYRDDAITLGEVPPKQLWEFVKEGLRRTQSAVHDRKVKVVITCERHAATDAQPYLLCN
jgi:ferredoxin